MIRKTSARLGLIILLAALAVAIASAAGQDELAPVRAATAGFHQPGAAQAAGWDLQPDLDHCFADPDAGAMGYHYINPAILDTALDAEMPEAMVYAPGPNDGLKLAAVEWIVPADAWDDEGHEGPPALLGHELHLNEELGVYVLHAWIWRHNPAGMFEDWNPRVTCP